MSKKKRKNPIALIIVLLSLLTVGGYYYYDTIYLPEKETELYKFEDVEEEITTEVICGEVYATSWNEASVQAECMENSPAKFFIGDFDNDSGSFYQISQTDKATYDSTVARPSLEASINFHKNMSHFLNIDYSDIPEDRRAFYRGEKDSGVDTLLGSQWPVAVWDDTIDEFFGTDIYDYLLSHKLVLSCDNIELTKLCGGNVEKEEVAGRDNMKWYHTVDYIYVGYAEVKTESAEGDLSDIGIFGDLGETVKVRIVATGVDSGIKEFNLERVD